MKTFEMQYFSLKIPYIDHVVKEQVLENVTKKSSA